MRIGVYFSPIKGAGGVYQYSVAFLEALSNIRGHKYVVIAASKDIPAKIRKLKNFEIIDSPPKISVSSTKISNNLSF